MEIIRVREKIYHPFTAPAVALGNFDGVHLGHQEIIRRTVQAARDGKSGDALVYTFDPHPRVVLNRASDIPRITTLTERAAILEQLGIDVMILAEFTREFAAQSAQEFVQGILVDELGARDIVIGENYRFGRGRAGDPDFLRKLAPEMGFRVHVAPSVSIEGGRVSSSRIREYLLSGDIRQANRLLGREFIIEGRVIHGHHRGKALGFPTANLKPEPKLAPPSGVYAAYCRVDNNVHPAVMNIGFNPTFQVRKVSYEVHILDFEQDLYGQRLKVYLVDRLRSERKFGSTEELVRQIEQDVARCRGMLTVFPRFQ